MGLSARRLRSLADRKHHGRTTGMLDRPAAHRGARARERLPASAGQDRSRGEFRPVGDVRAAAVREPDECRAWRSPVSLMKSRSLPLILSACTVLSGMGAIFVAVVLTWPDSWWPKTVLRERQPLNAKQHELQRQI